MLRFLFVFFSFLSLALSPLKADVGEQVSKNYQYTYELQPTDAFEIISQHGDIKITNSDTDIASLSITVVAKGSNLEKAEERLRMVNIQEKQLADRIQLETLFTEAQFLSLLPKQVWEVTYELSLPASHPLFLTHRYGDIYLATREGPVKLDLNYGKLFADKLEGGGHQLAVNFGNIEARHIQAGEIDCSVGQLRVDEADFLFVKSNGVRVQLGQVEELEVQSALGNIQVDEVAHLKGSYSSGKLAIGNLGKSMKMELKTGSNVTVQALHPEAEEVDIEGAFSWIRLGVNPEAALDLDAQLQRGDLKTQNLPMDIQINEASGQKTYTSAPIRTGRTSGQATSIKVNARFGKVTLFGRDS
ncbi:MAG: hypothetical protein AAFR61_28285 [Bacteroidota bacterium]